MTNCQDPSDNLQFTNGHFHITQSFKPLNNESALDLYAILATRYLKYQGKFKTLHSIPSACNKAIQNVLVIAAANLVRDYSPSTLYPVPNFQNKSY